MSEVISGEEFGQRRPPLSIYIKGILERYPDGQIFKEMIQNADDAGAKTVQFFIDHRHHGTVSLPKPDLERFQGPALISANDACFSKEDWEGIQRLQQSIKAEDPFKVGRFGIGFNSVYHVTDVPTIISGERVAFLDPREEIWPRESGKSFRLSALQSSGSDILAPFEGIAGFESQASPKYPKTLFRFPLRTTPSELSENVYTIEMVQELIDALRKEAKYLLLFLRSVASVEVHNISNTGEHSLYFKVSVASSSKSDLVKKRSKFLRRLKKAHTSDSYAIFNCIEFLADFRIEISDPSQKKHCQSNRWLVASVVGCSSPGSDVLDLAKKQHVFPWVGAALEVTDNPDSGRIFCFLPMPVETSSGYPVHVNATFSMNDDRRSLKWPGVERKNDPAAKWNELIVKELLPPCYAMLLLEAMKVLTVDKFYEAWPSVSSVSSAHWGNILQPLFTALFDQPVLWSENMEACHQAAVDQGEWVSIPESVFIPDGAPLPSVVHRCLCKCGVQLVSIPPTIWAAIRCAKVRIKEVSPKMARGRLRSKPFSYSNVDERGKYELLKYCLSDFQYHDLRGLQLLPLADGSFITFDQTGRSELVYVCSFEHPRYLVPNLNNRLVDISTDPDLQKSFHSIADSKKTQLAPLTDTAVASLLSKTVPPKWKGKQSVCLPDSNFTIEWFQKFWEWVQKRDLSLFEKLFIVPICSEPLDPDVVSVVQLKRNQAVVYIPSVSECSQALLSALRELQVMCCLENEFPNVRNSNLMKYMKAFDTNGVLDAICLASNARVSLPVAEAESLHSFISPNALSSNKERVLTLKALRIFKSSKNTSERLYSIEQAASTSVFKKALVEPAKCCFKFENLPPSMIFFSQADAFQYRLLTCLNVPVLTDSELLVSYVFPLIQRRSFPIQILSMLMKEVLDMFQVLQRADPNFSDAVSNLPFLEIGSGQTKTPSELYDPTNRSLRELFLDENVFPIAPFDSPKYVQVLKQCGLRENVSPQDVLVIIDTISLSPKSEPQLVNKMRLTRAKAVLKYISSREFLNRANESYTVSIVKGRLPFRDALDRLLKQRSWIPVLVKRPSDYPLALSWKGSSFHSHFVSLNDKVFYSTSVVQISSLLVGSQVYVPDPQLSHSITDFLPKRTSQVSYVLAQLKEIISCAEEIPCNSLASLVDSIYRCLHDVWERGTSHSELSKLKEIPEWIYLKKGNKFVGPGLVALEHNSSFRHDLEPYLWILPESLSPFSSFLVEHGVSEHITKSQIVSVLTMVQSSVSLGDEVDRVHTWGLVMSILNWITSDGTTETNLSEEDTLYVPIESDEDLPQLIEADQVVYTDNDFLKDFLQSSDLEDEQFNFAHERIHPKLAKHLGLMPLSEQLDISEDTFEDTGQNEPLTVRLKTILRDYKDGLTIIKELLQNADDAEATEVNICYDSREHKVPPKNLFFPGMLESHGPALIVHNNQTFAEEDFVNITKLGGATKLNKPLKIGKFGVGFCSVYHITDIPSFVSRDKLCIFDPTLTCLHKEIQNPALPGKKVKFTSKFIARSKQLVPYEGLFGFDSHKRYEGTMFRFPFRSSASELSGTCYTETTAKELMSDIQKCGAKLLLFLQHVKRITFQQINEGESAPKVLLALSKESVDLPVSTISQPSNKVEKLQCTVTSSSNKPQLEHWLLASDSSSFNGRNTTSCVACQLDSASTSSHIPSVADTEGELFCYLPLSQRTGLPVHVSSNFAVINNRRGIWTADDATSRTDTEVEWNMTLMETVIPNAYHLLLTTLQALHENGNMDFYSFYCLWPLESSLRQQQPWKILVDVLYKKIATSKLFYSANTSQWKFFSDSKFLKQGILNQSSEGVPETPACILQVLEHLKVPTVELPEVYYVYFNLEDKMITDVAFIHLFFENLEELSNIKASRNKTILCLLETFAVEHDAETHTEKYVVLSINFKDQPCIPSSPDGCLLKTCNELVNPNAPFADLFEFEKHHFPVPMLSSSRRAISALSALGMISNKLPWSMLIERAQVSIQLHGTDQMKALKQDKLILDTLGSHMEGSAPKLRVGIESVKFLPVLKKPRDYPITWNGEEYSLLSGKEMMTAGTTSFEHLHGDVNINIAGSQVPFVCQALPEDGGCGYISHSTKNILQIRNIPTCTEVIRHFHVFIEMFTNETPTEDLTSWAERISREVYRFLDEHMSSQSETLIVEQVAALKSISCVWTGKEFVRLEVISKKWKLAGPYLYPVPTSMSDKKQLLSLLQVKDEFTQSDIQSALEKMKETFDDEPIDSASQMLLRELLPLLFKIKPEEFSNFKIVLPDEEFVMHWSSDLAYNDAPWAPKDEDHVYVNGIISRDLAKQLHVHPVRSKLLEKYITSADTYFRGIAFGQREELTRRIQNILREYPFDITILKELLQNADDAKATKMYVILDKRTHGTQSVLSEEWQNLQGPALLVWNDSTFSEKDLKGIQELGLGSKRSDAESIGQYGIGFNVVYHLTDCPSFVTGGETLCIMDPHCRFVPGSHPMNPGRRYDNLAQKGFWTDFPDMRSAYLRCDLDNGFDELLGGSLFRFPIRHTKDLVNSSKLTENDHEPLSADQMQRKLHTWAPKMKDAMFFLNHVTELRFFVIESGSSCIMTERHYVTQVDTSSQSNRAELYHNLSAFKKRGSEPCVVRYPLSITEISHSGTEKESRKEEKWLIQQGVGDIHNQQQLWQYIENVKPRHGLAAPLSLPKPRELSSSTVSYTPSGLNKSQEFSGKVFCFLPLPKESKLPVHVNGHFILHANRRDLWHSTDPTQSDDRSRWNEGLLKAIASSYANLLVHAHGHYTRQNGYNSLPKLLEDVRVYYEMFPKSKSDNLDKMWLSLADDMYRTLLKLNAPMLAVVNKQATLQTAIESGRFQIEWHPIRSSKTSTQVYFWSSSGCHDRKCIQPILENIGMNITAAPYRVRTHLNKGVEEKEGRLPETTRQTVYKFFTQYSDKASSAGFPADIKETTFKTVKDFKLFTKYLLNNEGEFPSSPFGHPLLLTADGKLRLFDARNKVLKSDYSQLFPESQSKFLHSELLDIPYCSSYFLSSSDNDPSPGLKVVREILHLELPSALRASHVLQAEKCISNETLVRLWKCFLKDPVFKLHLQSVVKEIALILTTEGELYSTSSQLLPVFPPTIHQDVYKVLQQIKMPFISRDVVCASPAEIPCPTVDNPTAILQNLYHLHQKVDLSSLLKKEHVETLIKYIRSVNYRASTASCSHVKSLPLFESVDGSFSAIAGKTVCIWPQSMCKTAYEKWVKRYSVVFLKKGAAWESLQSSELLQIESICQEDVYVRYIFPQFSCMNEQERYAHLKHIRDDLYHENAYYRNLRHKQSILHVQQSLRAQTAISFLNALTTLCCLGGDGEVLRQVSIYCSPYVPIFKVFSKHFRALPKIFTENEKETSLWVEFFEGIGLRVSVTQIEFLQFCTMTAQGQVEDIGKSSSALVQYLFERQAQKDNWHQHSSFLSQVSKIAFVCTECLPTLTWIAPVVCPSNRIRRGNVIVNMTRFSEAVVSHHSELIWTTKSVVSIATFHTNLIRYLGVTERPSIQDILTHISNIAKKGKLSDFKLFDNYPDTLKPPPNGADLVKVMLKIFQFLLKELQSMSQENKRFLTDIPCIPVFNTTTKAHIVKWQLVLEKPKFVLTYEVGSQFHPFLHQLPETFLMVVPLLKTVGVKNSLDMHHMQIVLQRAYECSEGQELDVNTEGCIMRALKSLYDFLVHNKESTSSMSNADLKAALHPLYLPSSEKKLVLSTSLVHDDLSEFRATVKLSLDGTGLTKLAFKDREFRAARFCQLLPEAVRPKLLSHICHETVSPECESVDDSPMARKLKQTLEMGIIPRATLRVVKHNTKDEALCTALKPVLHNLLPNIKVVTVKNLRTIFKMKDSGTEVGCVKTEYFFHWEQGKGCTLYIDSKLPEVMRDLAIDGIASHLTKEIKRICPTISYSTLTDIEATLKLLLKAQTADHVKSILGSRRIALEGADDEDEDEMDDPTFELGKEIPERWHHRLDQDLSNIFHPMEYVGFEEEGGRVIFAQILHPVLPKGVADFDTIPRFEMKFKICTDKKDKSGITVGILDLFKFLRGTKSERETVGEESTAIVPYQGESDTTKITDQLKSEDLKTVKREICKQLKEIWKLPEDVKKRAIKRLYLKWHPDKNLDSPVFAEKVFKFLQEQIDRLEAGRPLADPDEQPTSPAPSGYSRSRSSWWRDFYEWEQTAHQHRNSRRRENQSRGRHQRHGGGGGGGGGGGFYGGGGAFFTSDHFRPQKRPEEGRKWMRQAEADLHALNVLYNQVHTSVELLCHVCFMAQQVGEKALKGAMFTVCGLDEQNLKSESISIHARALRAEYPLKTQGLVEHALSLEKFNSRLLYPTTSSVNAPADIYYDPVEVAAAKQHAEAILAMMKNVP